MPRSFAVPRAALGGPGIDPVPLEPSDTARLIDRAEFAHRLGIGASSLDRFRAAGRIGPRPVRVGKKAVRFLLAEVVVWLATPSPTGELYDAATWPAVWANLQPRGG